VIPGRTNRASFMIISVLVDSTPKDATPALPRGTLIEAALGCRKEKSLYQCCNLKVKGK
jgi:hypothetical protein